MRVNARRARTGWVRDRLGVFAVGVRWEGAIGRARFVRRLDSRTGQELLTNEATTRPRRLYLPQLDAMRFGAFLAVFSIHGLPGVDPRSHAAGAGRVLAAVESVVQRSGANGVGLFFLLSAFLITELLRRERAATGSIHLKKFYIRRLLRIWPLYYAVLLIGLLIQPLSATFHLPAVSVATASVFLMNWDVALHGFHWNPIFILWTISSEEQFYAVWPVLMRWLRRRRWMEWMCVGQAIVAFAVAFWPGGWLIERGTTDIGAAFAYFPIGGLLALWVGSERPVMRTRWCLGLVAGGLLCWFAGGVLAWLPGWTGVELAAGLAGGKAIVLGGTVLIFLGFVRSRPEMWPGWVVYLGKISYGLYMFHVLMLDAVVWAWRGCGGLGCGRGRDIPRPTCCWCSGSSCRWRWG